MIAFNVSEQYAIFKRNSKTRKAETPASPTNYSDGNMRALHAPRPMEPIHGSDICTTSMRMSSETLTICERAFLFAASKTPNNEEATDHTVCRFSGVEPQRALLFVQNTLKVSELGSVA
jgi:hypothetical protein